MIAAVVFEMAGGIIHEKNPASVLIMATAFAATCFFGVNAVYVILVCALIGAVRLLQGKGAGRNDISEIVLEFSADRAL